MTSRTVWQAKYPAMYKGAPCAKRLLNDLRYCSLNCRAQHEDEGQTVQNFWYLFVAYMVIWTAIFLYVVSLSRKNRELRDELHELRARVQLMQADKDPS